MSQEFVNLEKFGMSDEELVRFASACSAIAISRFPLPLNPPKIEEVRKLTAG